MSDLDISKHNLYIHKFVRVIKNQNLNAHKEIKVNGRHSDAFVYILSGSCTYVLENGDTFTAKTGDILYLAYHAVYTMYIHEAKYSFIYCDFEFNSPVLRKSNVYTPANPSDTESLFIKLLRAYKNSSFSKCMSLLYAIYDIILSESSKIYLSQNIKHKIQQAKKSIDIGFKDPDISIHTLAAQLGMSEVYFRKLFKSQYNTTPSQYIISLRLQHAKELMKYPFLSLEECAVQSGFSTLQYFCRVFKHSTGMTPSNYRKQA